MDLPSDVASVPTLLDEVLLASALQLDLPKEPERKYCTAIFVRTGCVLRSLTLISFV